MNEKKTQPINAPEAATPNHYGRSTSSSYDLSATNHRFASSGSIKNDSYLL